MTSRLRIAAAQFPVSGNIRRNVRYMAAIIAEAAVQRADVVHFPETSLPGYGPAHFESFATYEWDVLDGCIEEICGLASAHNLWVVFGAMRQIAGASPRNCTHVVSNSGEVVGTYDKQRLYKTEHRFYSRGDAPLVMDIGGVRCGFLICYDNCFPELYTTYRNLDVRLLFHSFHNAGNRHASSIRALLLANVRVRAADYQMWTSASNSSRRYSPLPACFVRPDGTMVTAKRHVAGLTLGEYPGADLGWTYDNRDF